ncbi:MAG: CotH kinase family protein [Candidatus Azobacteroides sp.]|nr:CotH kinase family protein [Candidatus Azobacteroides sp.]
MNKIYFITIGIFLLTPSLSAKIWINELMQSNIDLVRDDLQEFPDSWVELYNDADQNASIQNWYISDSPDYRQGWRIAPYTLIPAKGYLLIYCDKVASGLHTPFRLDSSGGSIYLFDAGGNLMDAVNSIPKQLAPNIARGRTSDGGAVWKNLIEPTPNGKNDGKYSDIVLNNPVFSLPGGIFRNAVKVSLSLPKNAPAGVALSHIHYTLDNSEPTLNSPAYTGELTISKTTVVKAKIIHPDYLLNRSQAHSYIIVSRDLTLPIISISLDSAYLWDDQFGIYCRGDGTYGKTGNGVDFKANWNNDWRRPANFEYFPSQGSEAVLNQVGEMRISGAWSRSNPQKTLAFYGNKRFGIKNFQYDLFSQKPGQDIRSFLIRNSGNDFWWTHFRDAAEQLFMGRKVDVDYQEYQPAIFYLNGRYWGIQNLRERSNEDFVVANYGDIDFDMIENWWGQLQNGDKTEWNRLMNELRKPANQIDYNWLMNQVDLNEYINYMILEIYVSNTDFPGNNVVMWKPKTAGGKWRFLLKDLDHGLGIWGTNQPSHNALQYNTENNNDDRKLFRALLSQDSFKKEFYSRFAVYLGDLLHYNTTSQLIDSIQRLLEPEMGDHLTRWIPEMWWRDLNSWRGEVNQMKNWCNQRNAYVYAQLKNYFNLGSVMRMTLTADPNLTEMPSLSINGVPLQKPAFDGSYFQNENVQFRFEGENPSAYAWEITATANGSAATTTYCQSDLTYYIPNQCTSLKINVISNTVGINTFHASPVIVSAEQGYLYFSGMEGKSVIAVYDLTGKRIKQWDTENYEDRFPFREKGVWIVKVKNSTQNVSNKIILSGE